MILLFSAQSDDLMPLFEKYGDVGDIYLPLERGTGRSRGFAFVRYSTRFYRGGGGFHRLFITKEIKPKVDSICFDFFSKKCLDLSKLLFFTLFEAPLFLHKKPFKRCTNNWLLLKGGWGINKLRNWEIGIQSVGSNSVSKTQLLP